MDNEEDFEEISNDPELDVYSDDNDDIADVNSIDTDNVVDQNLNSISNDTNQNISDIDNVENTQIAENDLVSNEATNQNPNKSSQSDGSSLKEKIDENKNKGYSKASSGKEAYQRQLDNKNYYNDKINNIKNQQEKLKEDKKENAKKMDSAEERLNRAKQNRNNNKNKKTKSELKGAKEDFNALKKESKEQDKNEKSLKKDNKNVLKDSKKSDRFKKLHPVEAAKMAINNKVKKIKKIIIAKVVIIAAPIILGLFLIFFVIELILGPIMEAFGHIDEAITNISNFQEKVENFYNGFGFQNSKDAFYDELDDLCRRYGDNLDVPLLLSTIFYTEGTGYDTEYGSVEDIDEDPSAYGSNSGIFSSVQEYLRDKYDQSIETLGEDGLAYSVGKIYRLRKLARNQFHTDAFGIPMRSGELHTATLSDFLEQYGSNISEDIKNMLSDILSFVFTSLVLPFNEVYAAAIKSDYQGEYFDRLAQIGTDFVDTFKILIGDIFYGIAAIEEINIDPLGSDGLLTVNITYRDYVFDEDNYNNYLTNYYLEYMPEFRELLPSDSTEREETKKQIINEIYENKGLFEEIFLQNTNVDSESYTENCVGAIDTRLVSELNLPVNIPDGTTIFFGEQYSYGITGDGVHKGVDLNSTTADVSNGADVFAIANGKVEETGTNDESNNSTSWIKISHNVVIDNNEYTFYSVYNNLEGITFSTGSSVTKGDKIGVIASSSNVGLHFEFHDDEDTPIDPTNLFIRCSTSTVLTGNTNQDKIWNYLLDRGYSKIAAAGIMGNWRQESAFNPSSVQDSSEYTDEDYTNKVNSGAISREDFGYDEIGYGIAQWTYYSRKLNLYDYKKNKNVSIDDLAMQLEFFETEASTDLYNQLNNSTSPECAADIFHNVYENSADTSTRLRQRYAKDIYDVYVNGQVTNSYNYCP